jgi:hypothetical protein
VTPLGELTMRWIGPQDADGSAIVAWEWDDEPPAQPPSRPNPPSSEHHTEGDEAE